jgi:hypothetical protein
VIRPLNGRKPAQLAAGTPPAEDTIDTDAVETPEETETPEEAAATPRRKSEPGKPKYSFLPDFNTSPEGVPSLREFCAGKNGDTEQNRYLLVTYWLTKYGGADPFNGNQVFTCFRDLSPWKGRLDVLQPVRELSSKKSFYTSPGRGLWKMSAIGIKEAEAIGPKS